MNKRSPYQCKEWIEEIEPFGKVQRDSHEWKEIIITKELQTLKCEICGKHSTPNL